MVGGDIPLHLKFALKVTHPLRKTPTSTSIRRSDETPHRPHQPQIFNILLTSNRTAATVRVYAMNSILA